MFGFGTTSAQGSALGQQIARTNFGLSDLLGVRLDDFQRRETFARGAENGGLFGGLGALSQSTNVNLGLPGFTAGISALQAGAPLFDLAAAGGGTGLANANFALGQFVPGASLGTSANRGDFLRATSASGANSGLNQNALLSLLLGGQNNGGGNQLGSLLSLLRGNSGGFPAPATASQTNSQAGGARSTTGSTVRAVNSVQAPQPIFVGRGGPG